MSRLALDEIAKLLHIENIDIAIENEKHSTLIPFLNENLFNNVLDKYLRASYLSHWKSTIENLILQNRQENAKKRIDELTNSDSCPEEIQQQLKVVKKSPMMHALYKIVILDKENTYDSPGYVSTDKRNMIDTIVINQNLTPEEKRCVIAHEFGHIIINRLLAENKQNKITLDSDQQENLADLFMYYILYDKSRFYQTEATNFIKPNIQDFKKLKESIDEKYQNNLSSN